MSENKLNSDSEEPLKKNNQPFDKEDKTNSEIKSHDVNINSDKPSEENNDHAEILIPETSKINKDESNTVSETESDNNITEPEEVSDLVNSEETSDIVTPEDETENTSEKISPPKIIPSDLFPKESNYQISLINQNLLKILVTANLKAVKIDSVVSELVSSKESQSNEIYIYPKMDNSYQEAEVFIAIINEEENIESPNPEKELQDQVDDENINKEKNDNSNYQINLINENLLKIKITTSESVKIDSVARDKKNSIQSQSNKIFLKQKSDSSVQKVEITIALENYLKNTTNAGGEISTDGKVRFTPNPEVMDLIQPPDYSALMREDQSEDYNTYRNPFDNLRKLVRKNLTIGLTVAVMLHLAAAGFAYMKLSKKVKEQSSEEPTRLIVIQDLPDPKIKIENIEDPNKPKIEEPVLNTITENIVKLPNREITPRKIVKPPIVTRPKREDVKLDSSVEANLTNSLDSLRKLRESELNDSSLALADSLNTDSSKSNYEIPDSLKNNFNENDIGLAMYFPKNWKITDQREINKNEKDFKGVVLTDTTAEQPGTMTMFIFLDSENKDYNAEDFKTEFEMNDSNLTAFSKEPKTLAGFTEYRFYIFNKTGIEKLSLRASVRKQFFDQYKNEIEAVVRSIRIQKKEDL